MSSLKQCLKKMGLSKHEAAILRGAAKEYVTDDGYDAQNAAVHAVNDYIAELAAERADIEKQIKAVAPDIVIPEAPAEKFSQEEQRPAEQPKAEVAQPQAAPEAKAADIATMSADDFDAIIKEVQAERKAEKPKATKATIIPTRAGVMVQPLGEAGEPVGQEYKAGEKPAESGLPSMTLSQTKHTKTGRDLWVVKLGARVDMPTFAGLKSKAKRNDGIWSNFTKGFNFTTPAGAEAFMGKPSGQTQAAKDFLAGGRGAVLPEQKAERPPKPFDDVKDSGKEVKGKPGSGWGTKPLGKIWYTEWRKDEPGNPGHWVTKISGGPTVRSSEIELTPAAAKNIMGGAPPGGWTEADKVPEKQRKSTGLEGLDNIALDKLAVEGSRNERDLAARERERRRQGLSPAKKPVTPQVEAMPGTAPLGAKTAGQIAGEAAGHAGASVKSFAAGMDALFGRKGTLGIGPSFDEETWAKAKPLFDQGFKEAVEAGKSLKEFVAHVLDQWTDAVIPYLKRWHNDLTEAQNAVSTRSTVGEDDSRGAARERTEAIPETGQVGRPEELHADEGLVGDPAIQRADESAVAGRHDTDSVGPERGVFSGSPGSESKGIPDSGDGAGAGAGVSTGRPGGNYLAKPGSLKRTGSWLDTAKRNVEIIKLVKDLTAEARLATTEEQTLIAQYTGFGASEIANGLFPIKYEYDHGKGRRGGYTKRATNAVDEDALKPGWKELYGELQKILEPKELETLTRSTQYAHFTEEGIIRSIWKAVQAMGFERGKILEPGAGTGKFMLAAPKEIAEGSRYVGVEMDHMTAAIAKQLLQKQSIIQDSYIDHNFPDNFFDLGIGNPPFAGWEVLADPRYRKFKFLLHDFFFAKTIDRTRPGGLLIFITSAGTMNKLDDKARKFLSERANLLGAIRLPQTAFKQSAGTEVVTDILFLQKKGPNVKGNGEAWSTVHQVSVKNKEGESVDVGVNEYFVAHPEMVLGTHSAAGTMYTKNSYTVLPKEGDIENQFAVAAAKLPIDVYTKQEPKAAAKLEEAVSRKDFDVKGQKEGGLYISEAGELMQVRDGAGVPFTQIKGVIDKKPAYVPLSMDQVSFMKSYVPLRDKLKQALADQLQDGPWEESQKALGKQYRAFVKKHGRILEHSISERTTTNEDGEESVARYKRFKWNKLLNSTIDAEMTLVWGLEKMNENDNQVSDGDILSMRVVNKPAVPQINTVADALGVTLSDTGRFDIQVIAERIGKTQAEVISELGDLTYEDPSAGWQLADEYLSGDVVRKLEEARAAAETDSRFERNVKALINAQPEPLGPAQIDVRLGANWVSAADVTQFITDVIGKDIAIKYDINSNIWSVPGSNLRSTREAGETWGTPDRSTHEILYNILNNHDLTIKKKDAADKTYTDKEATARVNDVAQKMRDAFSTWLWTDADRANRLLAEYNKRFNNLADRKFDGSHLTLPGLSMRWKPYAHQLRTIWRIIQTGNTYAAHAVGAGKTMVSIISAMEQRRLGLIKRPMFVVPNHMLEQFANEYQQFYPAARVLIADEENFTGDMRRRFVAKAALGDFDAVIIKQSSFKLIGTKPETRAAVADDILAALQSSLEDTDDRTTRKRLEAQIEKFQQRVSQAAGKDANLTFEDMGIDFLYVDEAHTYRKLDFSTNANIKGVDPVGSLAAFGMLVKIRHLESLKPGRSVVMMSGTPVTNTLAELYTIQRYMDYKTLVDHGIHHFDAWANSFTVPKTEWELNAAGSYEAVTRISLTNVPVLMDMVRKTMDVLTMDELGTLVDRPTLVTGSPQMMKTPRSPEQTAYMKGPLAHRLEVSKKWKPSPNEKGNPDPILNIITDGRFSAIDMRYVNPRAPSDPKSKLNVMIDQMISDYNAHKDVEYTDPDTGKPSTIKGATHIVFSPIGFGDKVAETRGFDAKAWIVHRLDKAGIKRWQIAFMGDYTTDAKKEAMFAELRSGKKRFLIGSPANMGTGLNVQDRLRTLHMLAPPWYPADIEQPQGRIQRQGNQNPQVDVRWYVTEGTYDATQWGMVRRKGQMIEKAFKGDRSIMRIDDLTEVSSYTMAEAIASGDQQVIKLAGLKSDVERYTRLQGAHFQEQNTLVSNKRSAQFQIKELRSSIESSEKAMAVLGDDHHSYKQYEMTVDGKVFAKPGEAGAAVLAKLKELLASPEVGRTFETDIGEIAGQKLIATHHKETKSNEPRMSLDVRIGPIDVRILSELAQSLEGQSDVGIGQSIRHALDQPEKTSRKSRERIEEEERSLKQIESKLGAPFEYANALSEATATAANLENELTSADKKAAEDLKGAEPTVTALEKTMSQALADDKVIAAGNPDDYRFRHYKVGDNPEVQATKKFTDVAVVGLPEVKFYVYNDKPRKTWRVIEHTTGLQIAQGDTKTEALTEADKTVERIGADKVRNTISTSPKLTDEQKQAALAPGAINFSHSEGYADPSKEESNTVQNGIDGKSITEAARFIAENGPADYRLIASRVLDQLNKMQAAGMKFDLKVAHIGDKVPTPLIGTRGMVYRPHGGTATQVWIQGSDVTGYVGTSYETVLHELLHAATQTALYVGNKRIALGTKLRENFVDLHDVSNAIVDHFNKRMIEVGQDKSKMTPFERSTYQRLNNSIRDEGEVISWAMTNRPFQEYLEGIPYKGRSLWSKFVEAVRVFLGLTPKADTALSEVMRVTGDILSLPVQPILDMASQIGMPTQINRAGGLLNNAVQGGNVGGVEQVSRIQQLPKVAQFVQNVFNGPSPLGIFNAFNTPYHKAQMLERKGMPGFKRVFDRLQNYLSDISGFATQAEQLMPSIMRELKGIMPKDFRQYFKGAAKESDIQAIGPWLNHGTLYGGGNPLQGVVWTDDELRGKQGMRPIPKELVPLTAAQIPLYRQAQAGIAQSLETSGKAVIHRHVSRHGITFDRDMNLADVAATVREQIEERINALNIKIEHAKDEAGQRFSEAERLGEAVKNYRGAPAGLHDARVAWEKAKAADEKAAKAVELIQADLDTMQTLYGDTAQEAYRKRLAKEKANPGTIQAIANHAKGLIDHGYMPLKRFGAKTVTALDEDGKTMFFGAYDGTPLVPGSANAEMHKVAAEVKALHPEWTVKVGTRSDKAWKMYEGLSLDALENFLDFLDPEMKAELERDATIQEYLKNAVNDRSVLKQLIHRKGTPGFSTDVPRILASFVTSSARNASGLYHLGEAKRLVGEMTPKNGEQGIVQGEAADLVEYVTKPGEEAAVLRSFLFFNFLGGSIAAAAVNLTQTVMTTAPYLSKYAGAGKLTGAIGRAAKLAVVDPAKMEGAIGKDLQRAELDGVTAPQQIYHLAAMASNNPFSSDRRFRTAMAAWNGMFGAAEVFNRRIAFIAAHDIYTAMAPAARTETGFNNAYDFAKEAVDQTQFIYNKGNRANLGRGAVGATIMTFKTFSISWLELLRRMPPKQQLMMLGVLVLMAGAEGLPFEEDLSDAVDTLGQWLGFTTNTGKWKGKVLADAIGPEYARPILKGLGGMLPLDLHSRLGMANLIPGTAFAKPSEIDKTRDVAEAFGPAGGVVKSMMDSLQLLARGKWDQAAVMAAPKAARDAFNGVYMASTGESLDTKGRLGMKDVTGTEAFGKAIGFNPQRAAMEGEAKREEMVDKNLRTVRMDDIASDWADGILRNDPEKRQDASNRLKQWNIDNPTMPINGMQMIQSVRTRVQAARATSSERFLKSLPKTMRPEAREAFQR